MSLSNINEMPGKGDLVYDPRMNPVNMVDQKLMKKKIDEILLFIKSDNKAKVLFNLKDKYEKYQSQYDEYMESNFKDFSDQYPFLFSSVITAEKEKIDMVLFILSEIKKIKNGEQDFIETEDKMKDYLLQKHMKKK